VNLIHFHFAIIAASDSMHVTILAKLLLDRL